MVRANKRGRPKLSEYEKKRRALNRYLDREGEKLRTGGPQEWCLGQNKTLRWNNGRTKCASYRQGVRTRARKEREKWDAFKYLWNEDKKDRKAARRFKKQVSRKSPRVEYRAGKSPRYGNGGAGKTVVSAMKNVAKGVDPTVAQQNQAQRALAVAPASVPDIAVRGLARIAEGQIPTVAQQRAAVEALDDMGLPDAPF